MALPRQRCMLVVCAFAAGLWCAMGMASPIQPFEAIVQSHPGEDVYARSGPGKERFYPTLKLSPGQKVTVRRKDAGGWYMIDPPEGSFSWISGKNVERNGQQGTVTQNAVIVRVGAFNSTQRDVEQVRLNRGDKVEILGEELLDGEKDGKPIKETWYRIKPPPFEYRWVKGSSLIELNPDGTPKIVASKPSAGQDKAAKGKPPALSEASPRKSEGHTEVVPIDPGENDAPLYKHVPFAQSPPPATTDEGDLGPEGTLGSAPRALDQGTIRRELQALSQQMRDIRQLPETQWDHSTIEPELLALQQAATGTPLLPLVELRIRELRRDQLIHQNAVEFAIREQRGPAYTRMLQNRPVSPLNGPVDPRSGTLNPPAGATQYPGANTVGMTAPGANGAPNPTGSRFQGAGIIARVRNPVPDVPRYVLIKPNGQLLCYLETQPGFNLEPYVGKAMGLNGQRGFDERLRADLMRVQQMTPVQLAQ